MQHKSSITTFNFLILFILFTALFPFNISANPEINNIEEDSRKLLSAEKILEINSNDIVIGKKNATITIIEYSSLTCPHCAEFHNYAFNLLKKNYIDKGMVLYVHRNFINNSPDLIASMLAHCSNQYTKFIQVLFENQESWAFREDYENSLHNIAKLSGMESSKIKNCINNKNLSNIIYQNTIDASKILNVKSIPTFFINGKKIDGAPEYSDLAKILDNLLTSNR